MTRWVAAAALAVCACSEPYILLEIDARSTVRDATELTVDIVDATGARAELPIAITDTLGFPKTLTIATEGRTAPFTIAVEARGADGEPVGRGRATASDERVGVLLEPEDFGVNAIVRFDQSLTVGSSKSLAVADDGSFMIVWQGGNQAMARLFDVNARPAVNAVGLSDLDFGLAEPAEHIALPALAHGPQGYIGVWEALFERHPDATEDPAYHLRRRVLDPAAEGPIGSDEFGITPVDTLHARMPSPVATAAGYVVAHLRSDETLASDALGEPMVVHLGETGVPSGDPLALAADNGNEKQRPFLSAVDDTRLVAVWAEWSVQDTAVRGRFVSAGSGAPGMEIAVTPFSEDLFVRPVAAPDGRGGFIAAWIAFRPDVIAVELQRFDAAGQPLGTPTRIASLPDTVSFDPSVSIAVDAAGNIAAAWSDDSGQDEAQGNVYLRMVRPNGMPIGAAVRVNTAEAGAQSEPTVAARPDGSLAIVWTDTSSRPPDIDAAGVRARIVYPNLAPKGAHGGTCETEGDCGEDLTCLAATGLCHQTCSEPNGSACEQGGKCVDGVCLFD